jgi:hypothetical protein
MVGGMLLALLLYYPGFHWIAGAANPALVAAQLARPVVVATDPATCAVQFDPVGTARFSSACDIAKSLLVTRGISYSTARSTDGSTSVEVGAQRLTVPSGNALSGADLKALKGKVGEQLGGALEAAGYPKAAASEGLNLPVLIGVLLLFVVAATALYGPQASALVEMFPTRVRYTAMSLPYHVGTGWVGGFLPVTSFALVAITGNIYASLWYPIFFTALSVVVAMLFLEETRGKPLEDV